MPDFDSFERIFKSVMAADLTSEEGALQISLLPEENKVKVVKGRSSSDLVTFLNRARKSLLSFFPSDARFSSSEDNRTGKDLLEVTTNTQVELKSGPAKTDANVGLSTVAWALDDTSGRVVSIMKGGQTERRTLLLSGCAASQIEASKIRTMDELAEFFNSTIEIGPAPERLAHFFRCIAVGLTKAPEIKAALRADSSTERPLMLQADWGSGLELYEKSFMADEAINVTRIERTDGRAHVIVEGSKSGRVARLYPNYKNGWDAPNGQKFEASNWVKTACFHVWIR